MNALEQAEQLTHRQNNELNALVPNRASRSTIKKLMAINLMYFMSLTKDEMRLLIKFLIESVEELEKYEKDKLIL